MKRRANGETIRVIRVAIGISQRALAFRVGITAPALSQIEHGVTEPKPETLRRIAAELGCSVAAISYPAPEPEPASA